jgi:N6-adenosine-specific RNA methylase IME4
MLASIPREIFNEVKDGRKTKKAAVNEVRQAQKKENLSASPQALPDGEFNIILADPPWRYEFSTSSNREIENQYPTMELEEICGLTIPAANDCVLFLWATSPKLLEALKVLSAWGFSYKTCMVWVKDKWGMGYYARQQHEILLIGTKGTPGVPDPANRPSSVIEAARGRHSEKPAAVYELIKIMFPGRRYLEMFSRRNRPGWETWGNEN